MSILFSASKFISIPILSQWLSIFDFVHLDVALCNHEMNRKFIALCVEYSKLFESMWCAEAIPYSSKYMNWMNKFQFSNSVLVLKTTDLEMLQSHSITWRKVGRWAGLLSYSEEVARLKSNLSKTTVLIATNCISSAITTIINKAVMLSTLVIELGNELQLSGLKINLPIRKAILTIYSNDNNQSTLIRSFSNVVDLTVNSCHLFTNCIPTMIVWCRKLRRLDVWCNSRQWCMISFHCGAQFYGLNVTSISERALASLLWYRCNTSLTRLSLHAWSPKLTWSTLNVSTIIPNVTDLSVAFEDSNSDLYLPYIRQFDKLKTLSIRCSVLVRCNAFNYLIEELFASGYPVTSLTLYTSFEGLRFNSVCYSLMTLQLRSVSASEKTDVCLVTFALYCPMLIHLTLDCCFRRTETGLIKILQHRRITYLNIEYCGLTINAISYIAELCCNSLTFFQMLTTSEMHFKSSVNEIVTKCGCLRKLVVRATCVDKKSLKAVAAVYKPRLKLQFV